MKILNRYPFSSRSTTIVTPDGPFTVKPFQVVVWVRLQALGRVSPAIPAFLDSGHNHNFSINEDQLRRWAGISPESLQVIGRMRINRDEVFLRNADVLIHRNAKGTCVLFDALYPLQLDRGIAVWPSPIAMLPILGMRGLMRQRLRLTFDGRRMCVSLSTGWW